MANVPPMMNLVNRSTGLGLGQLPAVNAGIVGRLRAWWRCFVFAFLVGLAFHLFLLLLIDPFR